MTAPTAATTLPTSTYVDDAYYAMLRRDLLEWDGRGTPLAAHEAATDVEGLLRHEAWLLDRRRFEEWLELFTLECLYWVPAVAPMPDADLGDARSRVTIAFDDRRRLGDRITWLRTGVAYSQLPESLTSHQLSGMVTVPTERPGELKVRSSFVLQEVRAGHAVQTFSGWSGHVLTEEDGQLRIARKIVCLLDARRGHHNLTFLL